MSERRMRERLDRGLDRELSPRVFLVIAAVTVAAISVVIVLAGGGREHEPRRRAHEPAPAPPVVTTITPQQPWYATEAQRGHQPPTGVRRAATRFINSYTVFLRRDPSRRSGSQLRNIAPGLRRQLDAARGVAPTRDPVRILALTATRTGREYSAVAKLRAGATTFGVEVLLRRARGEWVVYAIPSTHGTR